MFINNIAAKQEANATLQDDAASLEMQLMEAARARRDNDLAHSRRHKPEAAESYTECNRATKSKNYSAVIYDKNFDLFLRKQRSKIAKHTESVI